MVTLRSGVRSIMANSAVMDAAFDETELEERQYHHQEHQHDGLGRSTRIIEATETVEIDFIDHEFGRLGGSAVRHHVHNTERILETIRDADHKQKKESRRNAWQQMSGPPGILLCTF